jgi:alkylation response protein AidB-like acyl-CoA dehydrogenase
MDLSLTPEQQAIRHTVRDLMEGAVRPRVAEIDAREEFPEDVLALFRKHGIFATVVPPEYGGLDGSLVTLCLVCEEITRVCANSGMILGNQFLGAGPILLFGSEDQRRQYLPRLGTGELLCSFALSEPDSGSDAGSLKTRAVRDGTCWRLSGRKCFVTQASVADLLTVFARTEEGVSAFAVDRASSPWTVDKVEHKMGLRGSPTCSVVMDDVRVPASSLIGEPGAGLRIALSCLNKGRIMTAALALGLAQGALELMLSHAQERIQFGRPIADFQAIQFMLADTATELQAARALVSQAAWLYDCSSPDLVRFSAMAKLFTTDMVNRATSRAVQVLGGYGYIRDYPAERMMRDARVFAIFEGTNEIQRLVIARQLLGRQTTRC